MLLTTPTVRPLADTYSVDFILHLRIRSDAVDGIVSVLYTAAAAMCCYDATWGMYLCSQCKQRRLLPRRPHLLTTNSPVGGVRGAVTPSPVYHRFIGNLVNDRRRKQVKTKLLFCCNFHARSITGFFFRYVEGGVGGGGLT